MSLFSSLLNLHSIKPTEDFFTEIMSFFFSQNKDILEHWLHELSIIDGSKGEVVELSISTQTTFRGLSGHDNDSRPDIVIEVSYKKANEIIFIESKIGSSEMRGQLKRYADILYSLSEYNSSHLVYITRDFDPKDPAIITTYPKQVMFKQSRWYELFLFLYKNYETHSLVKEILTFMKEKNMSHNNKFTAIDLLAISNINKARKIMDHSLNNKVKTRFEDIFGSKKLNKINLNLKHNRYMYLLGKELACGIGYYNIGNDGIESTPSVGIFIEVPPKYVQRKEVVEIMTEIVEKSETGNNSSLDETTEACRSVDYEGVKWVADRLGNSKAWSKIYYAKDLQSFLSSEDHVAEIERFLLYCLCKLEKLMSTHTVLREGLK